MMKLPLACSLKCGGEGQPWRCTYAAGSAESELAWLMLPDIEVYYRSAFARMAELLTDPVFWVFSDDPSWCRQAFAAAHAKSGSWICWPMGA
jgi:hypothetical protein